jgi:hypothetical protein
MRTFVCTLLAAFLAACSPSPSGDPAATAFPTPAPVDNSTPAPVQAGATPEERARLVLAGWLDLPVDSVVLVSSEPVDWPDAGLGCPLPGIAYAQVVTPGFRFTLEANGETYFVHTDLTQQAVVCTEAGAPAFPVIPVTPGSIDDGQPWMPVGTPPGGPGPVY